MSDAVQLALYATGTLAGSFFCSLSEAALLSSSEARIRTSLQQGQRRAKTLLALKQDPGRTLASIVFLNNVFAIGGTGLITATAASIVPDGMGMLAFVAAWTFLVIAFGEIVPKVLGEALPEPIATAVAPTLIWVRRVLTPFVRVLEMTVAWARPKGRVVQGGEAEIRELARLGGEGGHIDSEAVELIHRVFRLDDIQAEDVMTPRGLVHALDSQARLADIHETLISANHSQFPVYEGDLDTVVGVLSLHTALRAVVAGEQERRVIEFVSKPLFLPTSRRIDAVLRDLQERHGRMAIVIDEYGITEGIITMDDLVEELVGEAIDDTDVSEGLVKRLSRQAALVHGLTRVRDVARFLKCDVLFESEDEEHTTVTGMMQERLGRIPETGDKVDLGGGLRLIVREADERSAIRVFARNTNDQPTEPQASD